MRVFATLLVLTACALPAASAQSTPAAPAAMPSSAMPSCDGALVVIRKSTITPAGSIEKFMIAMAAQQAWYKSHGRADKIFASRILVSDPDTKVYRYSDTEILSYHYYADNDRTSPPHDAAWEAFVKLYSDTSTITEGMLTCVPKTMAPPAGM
jgi:hypothetical protein